jgi:hypothetical protein
MNKRFLIITWLSLILIILSTVSVMVFVEIQQGKAEGLVFAKKYDKRACVRAVTKGKHICTEVSCFLKNRFFYQTCMDNARPSASLCKSVPPIGTLFQFEAWKNEQCKKIGRTDRGCHHIWQKVRNSCKAGKK